MTTLRLKKETSKYADLIVIRKEVSIGRNFDNNIIIRSNSVSRYHCLITADENNNVFVHDLKSKNGTFINNNKIDRIQVRENDVLQVGNERFIFILSEDSEREILKPELSLKSILIKEHSTETLNGIIIKSSEDNATEYHCPRNSIYTLGRMDICDIIIKDSSVSRTHATIEVRENRAMIADSSSTNGTYVNNVLVTQKEIKNGDTISLGENKFIVTFDIVIKERFTSLAEMTNIFIIDIVADYNNILDIYKNEYENHILLEVERQSLIFCQEFEQLLGTQKNLEKKQNSIEKFTILLSKARHSIYSPTLETLTENEKDTKIYISKYIQKTINNRDGDKPGKIYYFEERSKDNPGEIQMNGVAVIMNNDVLLLLFDIPYTNLLYLIYAASWMSQFNTILNETV